MEQEIINQLLLAARRAGWSDWLLATRSGVAPITIWKWRNKTTIGPRLTTIAKVAKALSVRISVENERVIVAPIIPQDIPQNIPLRRDRPFLWRMQARGRG